MQFLEGARVRAGATQLLVRAGRGDQAAVRQLAPLVYDELRALARQYLPPKGAAGAAPLQPTALVHEAFLRLIERDAADYQSLRRFLVVAQARPTRGQETGTPQRRVAAALMRGLRVIND